MLFHERIQRIFEDIITPDDPVLEERAISGSVDAFARTNTFKATNQGGTITIEVTNRDGYAGSVEIDPGRNEVTYLDPMGGVAKREKIPTQRFPVSSRHIKDYYVPQLLINTRSPDMFGGM